MTKSERLDDINYRIGFALGERNIQPKGSVAYDKLTAIIKTLRLEYRNDSKTRTILICENGNYYGVTASL